MTKEKCHLCGNEVGVLFSATLLGKYEAPYLYCAACDHVYVDNPAWLDEAYSEAIADEDTDIAARNVFMALRLAALNYFVLGDRGQGRYVDVAGGYGLLTRLMRDLGFDYYWSDPYAKNLFARGFECDPADAPYLAVSAIEALEHTTHPLDFIRTNLAAHQSDVFMFSTEVFPDDRPPRPDQWSYYAFETGQHIAFFSRRGLHRLAQRLGMHYYPLGRLHLFSKLPLPVWRLKLTSLKPFIVPLALFSAARLGSRRGRDQSVLRHRAARPGVPSR